MQWGFNTPMFHFIFCCNGSDRRQTVSLPSLTDLTRGGRGEEGSDNAVTQPPLSWAQFPESIVSLSGS